MRKIQIQLVCSEFLKQVIELRTPRGYFLAKEAHKWIGVDNATGDAWTEEFHWKYHALRWLHGKSETKNFNLRNSRRLQKSKTVSQIQSSAIRFPPEIKYKL